jgi:superoxide dismutase, Cu-Zn family
MMRRILAGAIAVAALTLVVTTAVAQNGDSPTRAVADLVSPSGAPAGTVSLSERDGRIVVSARVDGLSPGFHGFHVHAVGSCVGPDFASAGGHLNPAGVSHPEHVGDMPVLLVNEDGTATASFGTDRFRIADLFGRDGTAIIVHAGPDNYANIPKDRYEPDPDAMTLATGDSGGRAACGVVKPA